MRILLVEDHADTAFALKRALGQSGHDVILASTVALYGDSNYDCPEHGRVRPRRRTREDLEAGRFEPRWTRCGAASGLA